MRRVSNKMADSEEESSPQDNADSNSVSTRKNEGRVEKTNLARQRSYSTVSLAARSKLAGLIHLATEAETEGKTDYKKVADTVFDSLVGGTFDLENRFTIKDPYDLIIILELLEYCHVSLKVEILGLLIAVFRKSIPNLQAATKCGLVERILNRLPSESEVVADKLIELLGILSSYSITVKELKALFATLKGGNGKWPRHTVKLLDVLKLMPEKHGPDVYFNFTGQDGAAITLPPVSKWPMQTGFSFSTWICLDTSHIANAQRCKPHLYCFRTGKGAGYSAHFSGPMLVVESTVKKTGKRENRIFRHLVRFDFHPQTWYMVTVVHWYNRLSLKASEVQCFVDGKFVSSQQLPFPHTPANETYDKCYIGSSPAADTASVFYGQMGAVYVFSAPLTPPTVSAMYRLGPGYKGQFKFEAEIDIPLSEADKKALYDGRLAAGIMFMYSPKACNGQLCMEASPTENPSYFCHSPHALMLEGVQLVVTRSLQSALHSLGGIQMLLPLFTQLDFDQEGADGEDEKPDLAICTVLLTLLENLLRSSRTSQQQMLQCQGFLVISHLLDRASISHLTEEALNILLSLARCLLATSGAEALLGTLFDYILFNPNLWVKTPAKVQLQLFSVFATDLVTGRGCAAHMRRSVGVSRLMNMLKKDYWLTESPSQVVETGPRRPNKEEIISLRAFILLLVKQLVIKDKGIAEEELQSILSYLAVTEGQEDLLDVLQLVLSVMSEQPEAVVPIFDKIEGLRLLFKLLDANNEAVRVYALKIVGCFLQHATQKRRQELLTHFGLFSLIGQRIMKHGLTLTTYNVLFEILIGHVSKQIMCGRHPEPDSNTILHNVALASVIVQILHNNDEKSQKPTIRRQESFKEAEDKAQENGPVDLKRYFLSDLVLLLNHSKENRSYLLQLSCWQDWLFSLAYLEPRNKEEQKVTDAVFSLFRILLHHGIQQEREGWRIWVDTLAILHGRVVRFQQGRSSGRNSCSSSNTSSPQKTKKESDGTATREGVASSSNSSSPPRAKSPTGRNDGERKKFFEALLQSKARQTIPEEIETDKQTSESVDCGSVSSKESESKESVRAAERKESVEGKRQVTQTARRDEVKKAPDDSSTTEQGNEVKTNEIVENVHSEKANDERSLEISSPDLEGSQITPSADEPDRGATGVGSDLRGAEIANKLDTTRSTESETTNGAQVNVRESDTIIGREGSPVTESSQEKSKEFSSLNAETMVDTDSSSELNKPDQLDKTDKTQEHLAESDLGTAVNTQKTLSDPETISDKPKLTVTATERSTSPELTRAAEGENARSSSPVKSGPELFAEMKAKDESTDLSVSLKSSVIGNSSVSSEQSELSAAAKADSVPPRPSSSPSVGSTQANEAKSPAKHQESSASDNSQGAVGGQRSTGGGAAEGAAESSDPAEKFKAHVHIPEFLWSPVHQRLLGDLMFAIEADIQVWRSHTRKSVMDFVNAKENSVYLWNLAHLVSVLADNIIFSCGDLLPLLSSVTSRDFTQDVIEPCGGMTLETSFSFLNRLMSLVDVIVFTSSLAFSGVESNRNMSAGGFLRQCLRLVFCCAARNRLVCRQRNKPVLPILKGGKVTRKTLRETRNAIKALIASTEPPSEQHIVQNIPGHITTVTDPEKLLQELDVNRLRAVVYRDFEDSRQAQFLALTVVYFIAVMMVAKYRDMLKSDDGDPRGRYNTVSGADREPENSEVNGTDQRGRSSSWGGHRSKSAEAEDDVFALDEEFRPIATILKPPPDFSRFSLSEKVEHGFKSSGSLLREILLDFSPFLSRVLLGSHGQELILEGLSCQKTNSTVELVMLLCSQEWQNSLQRHGGMAFMELVNEGRLLSHAMRERVVMTTSEAQIILQKLEQIAQQKHEHFKELCELTLEVYHEIDKLNDSMLMVTRRRDFCVAKGLIQKVMDIMTSEHGAWTRGHFTSEVQFWRMDMWEDDCRRRMRFVKNAYGSSHPEATLVEALDKGIDQQPSADTQHTLNFARITHAPLEDFYAIEDEDNMEVPVDEKSIVRDEHGHVVFTTECHLIAPCVVAPGSLTITSTFMFFAVDEEHDEFKKLDTKVLVYMDCLHGKWPIDQIKAVFARRYLLQNCAVEVFVASGTSVMFKFADQQTAKKVVRALPPVGVGTCYGIPQTRAASLYSPKQLFNKSNMLTRWQRREVSNFQYLMFLNSIAGRTYCDLNQYPVFPWILTNFESDSLDLDDPQNYRDLSKPVGALNPHRHAQFIERYASWDENDDIPPFHYGTHYSTSGFTLAWLVRVEPFATQFLNLQGGKFDHPGRTFCSIIRSWNNCQRDTSDVKELIPELFYLPEMFVNSSRFTFGVDDDGTVLDDVELPRWASTPEEFIMLHRAALESDHVSKHLHEWIDLIFGFKQRGIEAVRATNVFFHLTYDGSVDLDSITDPVMREAVEAQIKSFGQTPCQLLEESHQSRFPANEQTFALSLKLHSWTKESSVGEEKEPFKSIYLTFKVTADVPVTYVAANTDSSQSLPAVVTISCNQCFSVNKWIASAEPLQSLRGAQIEQDPMLGTPSGRARRQLGEPLDQTVTPSSSCFVVTSSNRHIMASGYWDNSFKCFSTESGKLTQCVFGHKDVVTCLAYSCHVGLTGCHGGIVVSGSRDATLLVWQWSERAQGVVSPDQSTGDAVSPLAILTGHEQPLVCVDVNASLGLVVSGSQEGPCLVHSTSGDFLRTLHGPRGCVRPRLVKLTRDGLILISYSDCTGHLAVFTINGKLLVEKQLDDHMLAVTLTKDGNFFVAGGFSRYLSVWRTHDLALVHTYPPCDGSIRALDISNDQRCLVAGLASGSILAIAMDFSRWSLT